MLIRQKMTCQDILMYINANHFGPFANIPKPFRRRIPMATRNDWRFKRPGRRGQIAGTLGREHIAVLLSTIGARLSPGSMMYYRAV